MNWQPHKWWSVKRDFSLNEKRFYSSFRLTPLHVRFLYASTERISFFSFTVFPHDVLKTFLYMYSPFLHSIFFIPGRDSNRRIKLIIVGFYYLRRSSISLRKCLTQNGIASIISKIAICTWRENESARLFDSTLKLNLKLKKKKIKSHQNHRRYS